MESNLSWIDICHHLCNSRGEDLFEGCILDTVCFDSSGHVRGYLSTSRNGQIVSLDESNFSNHRIEENIMNLAYKIQPGGFRRVAMVRREGRDDMDMLDEENFLNFLSDNKTQVLCLQSFIPSKGNGLLYRTYRCTLTCDDDNRTRCKFEKLDVSSEILGSSHVKTSINMDKTANEKMEALCHNLSVLLQNLLTCKVLELVAEFVQDVFGNIWLVHTAHVKVEALTKIKRARSPDFKFIRSSEALERSSVSKKVELAEKSKRHDKMSHSGKNNKGLKLSPMRMAPSSLSDSTDTSPGLNVYGSSQLEGCPGDFCNFDVEYIANPAISMTTPVAGFTRPDTRTDLRRKLEKPLDDSSEARRFNNEATELLTDKLKGGQQSALRRKFPTLYSASMSSLPAAAAKEGKKVIAYNAIIQARNEMPLVKLMLLRHKNGEKGDYCTEENYRDVVGGAKLPSRYYKEVACCSACFTVYQLIEAARDKAIQKFSKKRAKTDAAPFPPSLGAAAPASNTGSAVYDDPQLMANKSIQLALQAIEGLTKLDIAEIRTMSKPPTAVAVVLEAVTGILTGTCMQFADARRLMGNGESFLQMLRDFAIEDVDDDRLKLLEPYVNNPIFRPEYVADVSRCASKCCGWVLGIVQAARWMRGVGHKRTDFIKDEANSIEASEESKELTFAEKLERRKAKRITEQSQTVTAPPTLVTQMMQSIGTARPRLPLRLEDLAEPDEIDDSADIKRAKRERRAIATSQRKSAERLSSQNKLNSLASGKAREFRCADNITLMQYSVQGEFSTTSESCNFVVIHDFFDTCDATSILMKPIVSRHPGCQVLCFNYPGQANTVWPRPPKAERDKGIKEPVLNNDWIADRLHELLQYTEKTSDFILFSPFHLVGIGNGACIAAAFAQRWGSTDMYAGFLRSVVSINGFLYPDAQLASILHSAAQVFESTPHSRPDIPVSFWSRFLYSEDYLSKVHPNLILNIHTAVNNPITNDGRLKLTRGCLQHRDIRGGLSPEKTFGRSSNFGDHAPTPVLVPIIVLQSTENTLVNASNVDPFLIGRHARHLWSHQQNAISDFVINSASDMNALPWVGILSNSPETYAKSSVLGKSGLRMILETLKNTKGAFVMWSRSGHCIQQESKQSFLDLMDALASPTEEYFGLPHIEPPKRAAIKVDVPLHLAPKVDVLFQLQPSTKVVPPELLQEPKRPPSTRAKRETPQPSPARAFDEEGTQTEFPADSADLGASTEFASPIDDSGVQGGNGFESTFASEMSDGSLTEGLRLDSNIIVTETHDFTGPVRQSNPELLKEKLKELDAVLLVDRANIPRLATKAQREKKEWTDIVPSVESSLALEAELRKEEAKFYDKEDTLQSHLELQTILSKEQFEQEQEERRKKYEAEDEQLLEQLRVELEQRRRLRDEAEAQRRLQMQAVEDELIKSGLLDEYVAPPEGEAVKEMAPIEYMTPLDLPAGLEAPKGAVSLLDKLLSDEAEAKKMGVVFMEDFDGIKRKMAQRQMERDLKLRNLSAEEQQELFVDCARVIQRYRRGFVGRRYAAQKKFARDQERVVGKGITALQCFVRRRQAKARVALIRYIKYENMKNGRSALLIQSVFRGHLARNYVHFLQCSNAATEIQKVFRGLLGRQTAKRERDRLLYLKKKNDCAMRIQSTWRMKIAKEEFRSVRIHALAAIEIQRCFRGHVGRKIAKRRRDWEAAAPGPERIKLGLTLIEESKIAFERQQEELDAIHRAQERAEARVSHIHADLRESEKELLVLEKELQEIDQIERDLINLTHEKDLLSKGITDAAGLARTAHAGNEGALQGREYDHATDPDVERRNKAEAFALEMTIQIKRAEREKKRQELETEFAVVFQEVEKKKQALDRLESSLADMEATRERKDREFRRLQSNLMQLLLEQKQELDSLREKGIELETATAMTASAAVATANKAMEHEKRSTAMFSQTEELMKFQFMSMSLSYFSSLNMLKQLRDMNADTTSAAVTSSANAAVAASASAIAANLPNMQKLDIGADDFVELSIQKKRAEIAAAEQAEREAKKIQLAPMPDSVQLWTVSDVCRWMDSLLLSQYNDAFKEARIDGPFLMELREEDMVDVLGITHKLHVRKIIVSREKLRPLSEQESMMKSVVDREDMADSIRAGVISRGADGVPTIDVVFSQARNGHIKRVEEAINLGFKIDTEDEKGNTLLLVGAQNSNKRLVELLLFRGANINHQNAQGNTALHFAMTYDTEGTLGEYLIERGANDTLENIHGFTPYDGVG